MDAPRLSDTKPYLLRALHEWCADNGLTPHVAVKVDPSVQVPKEYVKNGEIVLNVSHDATSGLQIGNDFLEFKARFGGIPRDIMVPISRIVAIYARENGQGMAFGLVHPESALETSGAQLGSSPDIDELKPALLLAVPDNASAPDNAEDAKPIVDNSGPAAGRGSRVRPSLKRVK